MQILGRNPVEFLQTMPCMLSPSSQTLEPIATQSIEVNLVKESHSVPILDRVSELKFGASNWIMSSDILQ